MNGFKKLNLGMSILIFLAAFGLHAEENQSSTSSNKVKASDLGVKQQEQKDIDEEITNARLRASTGSKSKISLQTDFAYSGGTFSEPFGKTRPKLSAGPILPAYTALSGNIAAKYRATDRGSINIGSGIGLTTPGYEGQRSELQDPYLTHTYVFKVGNVQNVLSSSLTVHSAKDNLDAKNTYSVDFTHTALWSFDGSGWQVGLATSIGQEGYSEFSEDNAQAGLNSIAFYPFTEYAFNDMYSFRTVYRGMTFYSNRDAANTYKWIESTQSMGLGVALTRDLYLYPNIQWVWRDIRADKTNVALSANINFF